ncbi:diacylglycerol kinase family protein [Glutamicibacter sp. MNS18]|uniref:diacylglycerol/lipid kinase family protein n=1 Tax=Glutamicibacter sp. MNS18 TaxID=2989817 RepID=UPI002235F074|nr:diacylglycerol kinase family protein [Glutamicibacter sp. MNS18]MCW4464379.1 diacylglycerol kinase family protein [Glutamicibacter sp. MNS18]
MRQHSGFHRVSIVFHPGSGRGKAVARAVELQVRLEAGTHEIRMLDTSRVPAAELHSTLRSSDAVVVVGGDGLIHSVLPALVDMGIPMGIIPAGSGNDAWRMGGARTVRHSLDGIAAFLAGRGRIRSCDLLELVYAGQPDETRYVLGAVSCGFEALVNARANALPRWLPVSRYALALLLCLPRIRGRQLGIEAVDFRFSGKVLLGSIANIRSLGGGIPLFPQARDDDGAANLMLVRDTPLYRVLPYLPRILRGAGHPYRSTAVLTSATVRFTGTSYGDGEPLGTGDFTLTVRPGALSLMDQRAGGTR